MARNTASLEMSSDHVRELLEESKKELLQSFSTLDARCRMEGTSMYHDNQEETAMAVANTILNDTEVVFQLVKAMTQTGKTGCMLAVIRSCFTLCGCDIKVNPDNIFIITGISSVDWTEQTRKRFPKALKDNVYHRGELKKLAKRLAGLNNVVILMDEVHVASKDEMTISKLLEQTGLRDMDYLRENNINFVEFSATPNKVMEDMTLWKDYAKQHIMQPGAGYKGVHHQLENGRVFQAQDLFIAADPDRSSMTELKYTERKKLIQPALDTISELKEKIVGFYHDPRYHVIRLPSGGKFDTVMERFKKIFGDDDFYHAPCHSRATDNDVQGLIQVPPTKHTLIYIKEHLRCAVTLSPKESIGILYDRPSINDDVMIQGLSGRATGYDVPDNMLVYTNIESLKRYTKVWDSGFTDMGKFTYQGSRTKIPKPTVFHPDVFENSGIDTGSHNSPNSFIEYNVFEMDQEKESILFDDNFNGRKTSSSPLRREPIKTLYDGSGGNITLDYVIKRRWGLGTKHKTRRVRLSNGQFVVYWKTTLAPESTTGVVGEPKPPTPEISGGAAEAD